MLTVLIQSALLLILGQLLLGAVGYVIPAGLPWLGLPLGVVLFWLILRVARVLRGEMEAAVRKRQRMVPWQMAAWTVLLWQWPAVILLPSGSVAPEWLGQIWNGAILPVQGTAGLISESFGTALGPWLWLAVVLEGLAFLAVAGRPLSLTVATGKDAGALPQRQVAAAGEWAPARSLKDVRRRHNTPHTKR